MGKPNLSGVSGGEKVFIVLVALAISVAFVYGWVWLVTLLVNFVLAAFGVKPVGMLLVWVCMLLLSIVGSYFRTSTVKVQQ
jgi:hypothetical protein